MLYSLSELTMESESLRPSLTPLFAKVMLAPPLQTPQGKALSLIMAATLCSVLYTQQSFSDYSVCNKNSNADNGRCTMPIKGVAKAHGPYSSPDDSWGTFQIYNRSSDYVFLNAFYDSSGDIEYLHLDDNYVLSPCDCVRISWQPYAYVGPDAVIGPDYLTAVVITDTPLLQRNFSVTDHTIGLANILNHISKGTAVNTNSSNLAGGTGYVESVVPLELTYNPANTKDRAPLRPYCTDGWSDRTFMHYRDFNIYEPGTKPTYFKESSNNFSAYADLPW